MISPIVSIETFIFSDPDTGETLKVPGEWIKNIVIYQSIESILPRMDIMFSDISDQREIFDIRGGITTELIMTDYYGHSIKTKFILNEVIEIESDSIGNSLQHLKWYKEEHFDITHKRLYKSYNDVKPSNLVEQWLGKVKISPTDKIEKFNCYGETINKNIRRLSYTSKTPTGDIGFLFFETLNDIFFMNLKNLIKETDKPPVYKVSYAPDHEYNLIDMIETKHYQTLNVMNQNIFKVKTSYFDFKTKDFKDSNNFNTKEVLDKDNLYNKELEKRSESIVVLGANSTIESELNTRTIFNRYQKKYEILINGSFDIYPGKVIYIEVPSKTTTGNFSKEHNGKFIITKTSHHIENGKMMTKCEVAKDSRN